MDERREREKGKRVKESESREERRRKVSVMKNSVDKKVLKQRNG